MDVLIFGATGMVGQGALRECLADPEVGRVVAIGRTITGRGHPNHHVTFDLTLAAARTLVRFNPRMCFIYVSGAGTDSTESGRIMWARVKGKTENALLALPFKSAFMLRPAMIQPLHGITSKTRSYRLLYSTTALLLPLLRALFPNYVTTTEQLGRVMISLAKNGSEHAILESRDINRRTAALAR
jgi:uncharacterized protein YbjT (DUF2867 family)